MAENYTGFDYFLQVKMIAHLFSSTLTMAGVDVQGPLVPYSEKKTESHIKNPLHVLFSQAK